jgi:hypothetical protein
VGGSSTQAIAHAAGWRSSALRAFSTRPSTQSEPCARCITPLGQSLSPPPCPPSNPDSSATDLSRSPTSVHSPCAVLFRAVWSCVAVGMDGETALCLPLKILCAWQLSILRQCSHPYIVECRCATFSSVCHLCGPPRRVGSLQWVRSGVRCDVGNRNVCDVTIRWLPLLAAPCCALPTRPTSPIYGWSSPCASGTLER